MTGNGCFVVMAREPDHQPILGTYSLAAGGGGRIYLRGAIA